MKNLKVSFLRSGIMVRYEDDYGVAAFILTRNQANELGRTLTFASLQPVDSGYHQTLINDTTTEDE